MQQPVAIRSEPRVELLEIGDEMRFLLDPVAESRRFLAVQHLEADDRLPFERIRIQHPDVVLVTHALGGHDGADQCPGRIVAEKGR